MHLQSRQLESIFERAQAGWGGRALLWHIQMCFQPDTEHQHCREKMCAGAFSRKQQQRNPFHFFQLESDARSCYFRESGFLWEGD